MPAQAFGHPDWQALVPWTGPALQDGPVTVPGTVVLGPYLVPQWRGVSGSVSGVSAELTVRLRWRTEVGGSIVSETALTVRPADPTLAIAEPNRGPVLEVVLETTASQTVTVVLVPTQADLAGPAPWSGPALIDTTLSVGAGTTLLGPWTVAGWRGVVGWVDAPLLGAGLLLVWRTRVGGSVVHTAHYHIQAPDVQVSVTERNYAPVLEATLFSTGTQNVSVVLLPTNTDPYPPRARDEGVLLWVDLTIPANSSNVQPLIPYHGPAVVSWRTTATNFRAHIRGRDYTGTLLAVYWDKLNGPRQTTDLIHLGRTSNEIIIFNDDAATQTFRVGITAAG